MRGGQRGAVAGLGNNRAEGRAAGQDDVIQTELGEEPTAGFIVGSAANAEHIAQQQEFRVVELEHGRVAEQFLDQLLGVVVAADVDVEELHGAGLRVLEQLYDGVMRFGGAQAERAEAHAVGLLHLVDQLAGVQDVVPCHAADNHVLRDAVLQGDIHGAGRPGVALDDCVDAGVLGDFDQFVAEIVFTDRADRVAVRAVVHGVVDEVDRGAACALTAGEHVPQEFAE